MFTLLVCTKIELTLVVPELLDILLVLIVKQLFKFNELQFKSDDKGLVTEPEGIVCHTNLCVLGLLGL